MKANCCFTFSISSISWQVAFITLRVIIKILPLLESLTLSSIIAKRWLAYSYLTFFKSFFNRKHLASNYPELDWENELTKWTTILSNTFGDFNNKKYSRYRRTPMSKASFKITSRKLSSVKSIRKISPFISNDINLIFLLMANIRKSSLRSTLSILPFLE